MDEAMGRLRRWAGDDRMRLAFYDLVERDLMRFRWDADGPKFWITSAGRAVAAADRVSVEGREVDRG